MSQAAQMLKSHPATPTLDTTSVARCIDACLACEQACTTCADACLSEESVQDLLHCIRTDLDCADICTASLRVLSRLTEPDMGLVRAQLESLEAACRVCADECDKHAKRHEHCRICADACRECAQACREVLESVPATAVV